MGVASRIMVFVAAALLLMSASINFRASRRRKKASNRRESYLAAGLIAVGLVLLVVSQIV